MEMARASGVLLHPTSLPGRFGIGELGDEAYRFVDFLASAGQTLWQIMPLGPTGYGDSPYASFSAFAGNPLLISLEHLLGEGLLQEADLEGMPAFPADRVDFGAAIPFKQQLLWRSFERWRDLARAGQRAEFEAFHAENSVWLDDFALFMALKGANGGAAWNSWPRELVTRQRKALAQARKELADEILYHSYIQFQFFRQWAALRRYASEQGIRLIGDLPIFVAYDSADVWANPNLFFIDEQGTMSVVAGVPPDYFSETGQRWGNPLYRWDVLARNGYRWWVERFRQTFKTVDIVRLDHFRGFEAYWEVPAEEETAMNGRWVQGPGAPLFKTLERKLGSLPIIAEDLGLITPEVDALRLEAGFPGMRVLQFAFDGRADNPYLPYNYVPETVVYTGTHDNDTTNGWYGGLDFEMRERVLSYIGRRDSSAHWELLRLALASTACWAIIPLQDLLGLGSEARMNTPGVDAGNWGWRYQAWMLNFDLAREVAKLVGCYGRDALAQPVEKELQYTT
jgi:4-alpha-glucanotransferase